MRDPVAAFNAVVAESPAHGSVVSSTGAAFRAPSTPAVAYPSAFSTDYWRSDPIQHSIAVISFAAAPPPAIDAASVTTGGFFGIESRVTQVSSPYGGAVATGDGVLNPSLPPALDRLTRFSFLGALSSPGRTGHVISPNAVFRSDDPRIRFLCSPSLQDTGSYKEAPPSTVLLPDFDSNFIASFPMLDRNVRHCVSDMGRRFELFVDNGSPRDVARLLRLVGVDCGFSPTKQSPLFA